MFIIFNLFFIHSSVYFACHLLSKLRLSTLLMNESVCMYVCMHTACCTRHVVQQVHDKSKSWSLSCAFVSVPASWSDLRCWQVEVTTEKERRSVSVDFMQRAGITGTPRNGYGMTTILGGPDTERHVQYISTACMMYASFTISSSSSSSSGGNEVSAWCLTRQPVASRQGAGGGAIALKF